jgi:TPR repeat protein
MEKLFDRYASEQGVEASSLCFFFDGEPIEPTQTARMLGLKDRDEIHCDIMQHGNPEGPPVAVVSPSCDISEKKIQDLKKEAALGDAAAMFEYGFIHSREKDGYPFDTELAFSWFKKAHEAGSVQGTALYGEFLCHGLGGAMQCHTTGMIHVCVAAGQGSDHAAYSLGMAMANGLCGIAVNTEEAIHWLKKVVGGECPHEHLDKHSIDRASTKLKELQEAESSRSPMNLESSNEGDY